jgi:hypothetical protein
MDEVQIKFSRTNKSNALLPDATVAFFTFLGGRIFRGIFFVLRPPKFDRSVF